MAGMIARMSPPVRIQHPSYTNEPELGVVSSRSRSTIERSGKSVQPVSKSIVQIVDLHRVEDARTTLA